MTVNIGDNRMSALWRAVIGIPYLLIMSAVLPVIGIVFVIAAVVDVLWRFIANADGVPVLIPWSSRIWHWVWDDIAWILFGEGQFELLP